MQTIDPLTTDELANYPGPHLAVDVVVLTIRNQQLHAVLVRRPAEPQKDTLALPGGFIHPDETAEATVARVLREKTGLENIFSEQLFTFTEPTRDSRGWVVSVAYYALIPQTILAQASLTAEVAVLPLRVSGGSAEILVDSEPQILAFDHQKILELAVARLAGKIWYTEVALSILPEKFSLLDLQRVFEAILGKALNKTAFRKQMTHRWFIEPTGEQRHLQNNNFRPPALYRRTKGIN
jgi:8-oxo-dGTP diphosphatase